MMDHPFSHSITLFEHLYADLPPLFSDKDRQAMRHALDHLKNDAGVTEQQVEDTLITFGKKVWPYSRAFSEFYARVEKRRGDEFFEAHVREHSELEKWFREFQGDGGRAHELLCGSWEHVGHLTSDMRGSLCNVLAETKRDLKNAAAIMVAGPDKNSYKKKVIEFTVLLESIEERLNLMRQLADNEQEHPQVAAEMRTQVRAFEKGLAFLHKHTTYEAVCEAVGRVPGRRAELASY